MTATYHGRNNIPFHPGLTTLRQQRTPDRICLLDAARGSWLPQALAELFCHRRLGIAYIDWLILSDGPENTRYWDAWQQVLDQARLNLRGRTYRLVETEQGHLFAVEDTDRTPED